MRGRQDARRDQTGGGVDGQVQADLRVGGGDETELHDQKNSGG